MQHIADDHDALALDRTEALADGQRVEQGLGRMFVRAVARVDDIGSAAAVLRGPFGQLLCCTRRGMTDDQGVGARRPQRQRGVAQRFPFGHRRSRRADVDHIGAHPFARHFEGNLGARRVLVEHRDDGAATERGQLLDLTTKQGLAEPIRVVEDRGRLVAREVRRRQQMASRHLISPPRHGRHAR